MLSVPTLGLALALAAPATPLGGDGGKIAWEKNPQKAMELARKVGSGMMLYFTSEG